ncbi:hypothetical protein AB4K20DRAFT_1871572 [Rhizopus microsporus]|uniref:Uncharacterized protein n=1 Tax=Rhizopus microsporus TaxID=58291 RepID=A0A1X0RRX0_RHIZD|nr:hypothetical protein BCV71DRAFT_238083 [Rhizopus microsporus]
MSTKIKCSPGSVRMYPGVEKLREIREGSHQWMTRCPSLQGPYEHYVKWSRYPSGFKGGPRYANAAFCSDGWQLDIDDVEWTPFVPIYLYITYLSVFCIFSLIY